MPDRRQVQAKAGGDSFRCARSPLPRTSMLALEEGWEVPVGEKEGLGWVKVRPRCLGRRAAPDRSCTRQPRLVSSSRAVAQGGCLARCTTGGSPPPEGNEASTKTQHCRGWLSTPPRTTGPGSSPEVGRRPGGGGIGFGDGGQLADLWGGGRDSGRHDDGGCWDACRARVTRIWATGTPSGRWLCLARGRQTRALTAAGREQFHSLTWTRESDHTLGAAHQLSWALRS